MGELFSQQEITSEAGKLIDLGFSLSVYLFVYAMWCVVLCCSTNNLWIWQHACCLVRWLADCLSARLPSCVSGSPFPSMCMHAYTLNEILLYLCFFLLLLLLIAVISCWISFVVFLLWTVVSVVVVVAVALFRVFLVADFVHSDRLIPTQRCNLTQRCGWLLVDRSFVSCSSESVWILRKLCLTKN